MEKIQKRTDYLENAYLRIIQLLIQIKQNLIPYIRRTIRFIALPYCYFKLVNWGECTESRYQVSKDLLYIFFKLKYFPDNYSLCRLWEKPRSDWRFYYGSIYDSYQRGRLRKRVQPAKYEIIFKDKNVCYQLCKANDIPLPIQYAYIEPYVDYKALIESSVKESLNGKLIIKPIDGSGGQGIVLAFKEEEKIVIQSRNKKISLNKFILQHSSVLQEFIEQHDKLNEISPSVNTIRIVTLLSKENNVIFLGSYMRFGVNNLYVDNVSSGGLAVGIDIKTGLLKDIAYDNKGRLYRHHPTSKVIFKKFQIPFWLDLIELAKRTQHIFSYYKMLGHDIAITSKGPVIIEINEAHDNIALEQRCGPILSNEEIRTQFMKYDLLINRLCQK